MIGQNLNDNISMHYTQLTKSSRKIADYLAQHAEQAQYLSISALAKECDVAEATIFRFCRALGFEGYNELKIALAQSNASVGTGVNYEVYGSVEPTDDLETLCARVYTSNMDSLVKTRSVLDLRSVKRAVDMLEEASRIYCLGQGGSLMVAMDVWSRFVMISDKFYNIQDSHLQMMTASLLGPKDVILFFSYSGATRDLADLLRLTRQQGTRVILVTRQADSPAARQADCVLLVGGREGPMQSGSSIPAKVAMLFVADTLVNEYTRRNMDSVVRNRNATSSAIAAKLL